MDQAVVVSPTADAVEPRLEQLEFAVAKPTVEFFQQEHGSKPLFEHRSGKEVAGYLDEKVEPVFSPHFVPEMNRGAAQVRCMPSVRLDYILEKPPHTRGVLVGAGAFQCAADLGGHGSGRLTELFGRASLGKLQGARHLLAFDRVFHPDDPVVDP
jgi:hypothetical protein